MFLSIYIISNLNDLSSRQGRKISYYNGDDNIMFVLTIRIHDININ